MLFRLLFTSISAKQYKKLDGSTKIRIKKKLILLKESDKKRRHLHFGLPFYVEEVGQFRIVYKFDKLEKKIVILFIGKHKDYERFLEI